MEFPRQEYWGALPFPTPVDLPDPGIQPMSCVSYIDRQILYHFHLGSPLLPQLDCKLKKKKKTDLIEKQP